MELRTETTQVIALHGCCGDEWTLWPLTMSTSPWAWLPSTGSRGVPLSQAMPKSLAIRCEAGHTGFTKVPRKSEQGEAMPSWLYAVIFCVLVLAIGFVVDRRSRAVRAGLEVPADTAGRSRVDGVARARLEPGGGGGLGSDGGNVGFGGTSQ
jgi:hypothetical protein